jgi:hypothetical protein
MSTDETKFIGFRASDELSEAAKKRAKEQNRSLAGYLRNLLQQDLEDSGWSLQETPKYGAATKEEDAPPVRSSSPVIYPKKTRKRN